MAEPWSMPAAVVAMRHVLIGMEVTAAASVLAQVTAGFLADLPPSVRATVTAAYTEHFRDLVPGTGSALGVKMLRQQREMVAAMMLRLGIPTGHGDDMEALVGELELAIRFLLRQPESHS